MKRRVGAAALYASTVAVLCPHCATEQPAPDNGSDLWTPEQIYAKQGSRVCVSCDEPYRLTLFSTVQVDRTSFKA